MRFDVRELYDHGIKMLEEGDINAASETFNLLLNNDDENILFLFSLAVCEMKKNHFGLSTLLNKLVVRIKPEFSDAWSNLGVLYKQRGLILDARKSFSKAIEIEERNLSMIRKGKWKALKK